MSHSAPDDLAAALKALQPAPAALDRDRLMYRAGQSAAAARCRSWRWATALSSTTALALGVALLGQPAPEPIIRVVEVRVPQALPQAQAAPAEATAPASMPAPPWLEQALVDLDEMPPLAAAAAEPGTPARRNVGTTWEWRREVIMHPTLLEGID
jgi:hypothetical protein